MISRDQEILIGDFEIFTRRGFNEFIMQVENCSENDLDRIIRQLIKDRLDGVRPFDHFELIGGSKYGCN